MDSKANNQPEPLSSVPDSWPGAFGLYKYSKKAVKVNLWTFIILELLFGAISFLVQWKFKTVGDTASFIVDGLGAAALTLTYLAGLHGQRLSVGQALSQGLPFWLKMIGLNILVSLSLVTSILCLFIPFFFVLPRLTLANYFLVDKKLGIIEAYKASWAATKGHSVKVWGVIGASIAMALLFVTIIGIPFAIYFLIMYSAAMAVLYEFITKTQAATPGVPSAK